MIFSLKSSGGEMVSFLSAVKRLRLRAYVVSLFPSSLELYYVLYGSFVRKKYMVAAVSCIAAKVIVRLA
jgi:hypothetical protein